MTSAFLAVLAPAIIWMWFFHRQDKRPEPVALVGLAFFAGLVIVYPSYLVQVRLLPHLPELSPEQDFDVLLLSTTVLAGLIEEMAKFAVVLALFCWRKEFDEPVDGLIYAVTVAIGFTAGEDFLKHSDGVDWARLINPPGHAMFAAIWGYGLGMYLVRPRWEPLAVRLAISIGVHGLWDALSIYREIEGRWWLTPLVFLLAFGLFWVLDWKLRLLQDPALEEIHRRNKARWRQFAGLIPAKAHRRAPPTV